MRVAIEAATLTMTSGGLARYTSELSLALARCFPDDEFYLVSDQPFSMPRDAPGNLRRGGGPRNAMERRWWLWGLPREMARLGADLVHGPDFAVPYLLRRPSVLTIHDLSPWLDVRWHHAAERVRRRTPVLLDLGLGTMVITPGESVRKAAIERFRLRPERVVAVPEAAASWLRPVDAPPPEQPYFLFVGTLEPRKNLEALTAAWREVRRTHPVDLVIAGRRRADAPEIEPEAGLRLAGEVADTRSGRALFRRHRARLPVAVRRLRPSRAGSDAVRRARHRFPGGPRSRRRRAALRGRCAPPSRKPCVPCSTRPRPRPKPARAPWRAPPNSPGSAQPAPPARSTRKPGSAMPNNGGAGRPRPAPSPPLALLLETPVVFPAAWYSGLRKASFARRSGLEADA